MRTADLLPFGVGALGGVGTTYAARRRGPRVTVLGLAGGLVAAAAIYPAARRPALSGTDRVEVLTLAGTVAAALLTSRLRTPTAGRLVAAGWAAHAVFDARHGVRGDSRLPSWYPSLCAGYDLAVAAALSQQ